MQSTTTRRLTLVTIGIGLVAGLLIGFGPVSAHDAGPDRPLTIHGADAETTALIEKAIARYVEAGLGLPNVEFFIHTDPSKCHGHEGYWQPRSGADRIDLCEVSDYLVLHELGHAFEHHFVDDATREAFMDLHPGSNWRDEDVPHRAQGIEQFADAVAWGLQFEQLDTDGGVLVQRIIDEKSVEFELVTGIVSPRLVHAH